MSARQGPDERRCRPDGRRTDWCVIQALGCAGRRAGAGLALALPAALELNRGHPVVASGHSARAPAGGARGVCRARDRSPTCPRDGSDRCARRQATRHARRHSARWRRARIPSRSADGGIPSRRAASTSSGRRAPGLWRARASPARAVRHGGHHRLAPWHIAITPSPSGRARPRPLRRGLPHAGRGLSGSPRRRGASRHAGP